MLDALRGTAFGGHLGEPESTADKVARTEDGGRSWRALSVSPIPSAIYGGLHVPGTGGSALAAVGPGGAAVSVDGGESWRRLDERPWWGIGSGGPDATWITGPGGRIARIRLR
jgi:photosystem II stability/assembly factor-like uncharacterized protein